MVSAESVEIQLAKIKFNSQSWGRTEVGELHNILLPDEQIYECVNGIYEGGFALLVATNVRVLLVDKKPMNYLTVEDLRFDMINELDYSHRLLGAHINISAGNKNLSFRSYNQVRLRRLINHVQNLMAEFKNKQSQHSEGQNLQLSQLNQQLEAYLWSQFKAQQEIDRKLREAKVHAINNSTADATIQPMPIAPAFSNDSSQTLHGAQPQVVAMTSQATKQDLFDEGFKEVFGKRFLHSPQSQEPVEPTIRGIEVNDFRVAYSKLPMVLRNRKFGRHTTFNKPLATTSSGTTPLA